MIISIIMFVIALFMSLIMVVACHKKLNEDLGFLLFMAIILSTIGLIISVYFY